MARYGMVIDLDRCSGCQTCVVTCQMHNNTRPGVAWGSVDTLEIGKAWPDADRVQIPHACMHCDDAPCVAACPTGASIQREDGIVVVDYETCIGCEACVSACPFGARHMSTNDTWFFDAAEPSPYEAYGPQRINVAEKCTFCAARTDEGLPPHCVDACPNTARIFGDLDDPTSDICAYIEENGAEQIPGTSVYYVRGNHDIDLTSYLMNLGVYAQATSTGSPTSSAIASTAADDEAPVTSEAPASAAADAPATSDPKDGE